jgi:hypothetical protein
MRITESQLRKIVREVIAESTGSSWHDEVIKHDDDKLLVQRDDVTDEGMGAGPGGYDVAFNTIPEADFDQVRIARFKASGMSHDDAVAAAKGKLKHRGQRPGKG